MATANQTPQVGTIVVVGVIYARGRTYTGQGYLDSDQVCSGARGQIACVAFADAPAGTSEYVCSRTP